MFVQDQILNGTYQILQPIGSGGSSNVYLAYHVRLQKYVVIKKLKGEMAGNFRLRTEVDTLKNLHHPNLPQVYDFIEEQGSIYTVIDYVNGNDLQSYINSGYQFTEEQLKRLLRQIVDVLVYLHSQHPAIIHSDIKPENVIINQEGNAILIDFNTSIGQNKGNLLGLTLCYASPEQIRMARELAYQQYSEMELDPRSDLFSLGATFYELISGIRLTPDVPPRPLHTMGFTQYSKNFLLLIDNLLEYDREKRIKSAKNLLSALDRMDSRYWMFFGLRCASALLCALIISAGIFCCIRGSQAAVQERFQTQYATVSGYIADGYLELAQSVCDDLLADSAMNAYLRKNSGDLAQLYHALGDIAYYSEKYSTAMTYYEYALKQCEDGQANLLSVYLRDAAISSAQAGKLDQAQKWLEQAKNQNSNADDLRLIQIVISARMGQTDYALEQAQELIDICNQNELRARAALCAASVAPNIDSRIEWLIKACQYGGGRSAKRGLAAAYMAKADSASNEGTRHSAWNDACKIYKELNESRYASSADCMNYATVLRRLGKHSEALNVLEDALQHDENNYMLLMNMCFVYHEQDNTAEAARYCSAAIRAWKSSSNEDKHSENSEEIQNLMELARRYGVGG